MIDEVYPRLVFELIPDELKQNASIQSDFLSQDCSNLNDFVYGGLLRSIYKYNDDSDIGLQYGKHLYPSTLCDLSRLLMTADTIGDAIALFLRLHHLLGSSFYPFMIKKDGIALNALIFPFKAQVSSYQRRFVAEAAFSYVVNAIRSAGVENFLPLGARFDYPSPRYHDEYQAVFGNNLQFDAKLNVLEIDADCLSVPLATRDPVLHKVYLNKCSEQALKSQNNNTFRHNVITCMLDHHPESFTCDSLAQSMNLSVRVMQRKLNKEGLSFLRIVNQTRRELAKIYLLTEEHTLEHTAQKLGFQSREGFLRFFKAQFGMTPVEYVSA